MEYSCCPPMRLLILARLVLQQCVHGLAHALLRHPARGRFFRKHLRRGDGLLRAQGGLCGLLPDASHHLQGIRRKAVPQQVLLYILRSAVDLLRVRLPAPLRGLFILCHVTPPVESVS